MKKYNLKCKKKSKKFVTPKACLLAWKITFDKIMTTSSLVSYVLQKNLHTETETVA